MTERANTVRGEELGWSERSHGESFGHRRKTFGSTAGGEKLGCSLYEIPPGRRAWPYHYHLANEEAVYVLEGSGTLRTEDGEGEISAGDYVAFPAGGGGAHQVVNSSDAPLRYLCFSTMIEPDIVVYPDSGKVGLFAGAAPGGHKGKRTLHKYLRYDAEVGYYDGEG